jgi:glucose-6-phosphate 1-dehydrogenase
VEPVLGAMSPLYLYEPNSWGPVEADQLTAASGRWCDPITTGNEMQGAE